MRAGVAAFGVAKPLDSADADGRVESACPKGYALSDIGEQEVALDVSLQGDIEHGSGDVHADPDVRTAVRCWCRGKDFAGETGTTAYVEDEGRRRQGEELEGTVGHFNLHILYAGRCGVLARLGIIVEEVGRAERGSAKQRRGGGVVVEI